MAWSAQLTYVVADGGPAAIVVLLLVHVATPVDTRRAIVDTTGDPLHAIQGPTVWVWGCWWLGRVPSSGVTDARVVLAGLRQAAVEVSAGVASLVG